MYNKYASQPRALVQGSFNFQLAARLKCGKHLLAIMLTNPK